MKKILFTAALGLLVISSAFAQTITADPLNETTCSGQPVMFSVTAQNVLSYQWEVNILGFWYAIGDTGVYSGTTTAQLNISDATGLDGYVYHCVVTDSSYVNSYSGSGLLTVQTAPSFTLQPIDLVVCAQAPASFSVGTTGNVLTYRWQADNGIGFTDIADGPLYTGTSSDLISVNTSGVTSSLQNTQFRCIITGSCGMDTSNAVTLTLNALPTATVSLTGNGAICQGDSTQLTASSNAIYSYQWLFNSVAIGSGTSASLTTNAAGNYSVVVTDVTTGCNSTSSNTTVTVNPSPLAGVSLTSANGVCQGDSVSLSANLSSGVTYQWQINGADIAGATNSDYHATTGGDYTVMETNAYNCSATSTITSVIIHPLPVSNITYNDPLSFCEGSAVVLNADTSEAGLSYQWIRNGVNDAANTSYYNIVNTSGTYTVSTTSTYGCTSISAPVNVTVNPLPQPVINLNSNTLSTGNFVTYQWYFNNQPIPGATSSSYSATQTGDYSVEVTDVNGCPNKSAAVTISSLGVDNLSVASDGIRIYPNPTSGTLHVIATGNNTVSLRNIEGRVVFQQSNATDLDLSSLAKGMYLLTVTDSKGAQLRTEKIVLAN